MSDQGEIPHRQGVDLKPGFDLIETLRWTRDDGFYLLEEHIVRLEASAASLGFRFNAAEMRGALAAAAAAAQGDVLRARLTLRRDGAVAASAVPIDLPAAGSVWRVALAPARFDSADPLLRHKTTRRALYEDALSAAQEKYGADEVIFRNERDELCEGARCNLFVADGEALLTPPLVCGLLPGVLRAHLLKSGRAREAVLRLANLWSQRPVFMGNSVRGLVAAQLIGASA
jgi:4-amino-4-deoxychorismate lyase